jgi:DNA-binding MarR family transcriptional regulator
MAMAEPPGPADEAVGALTGGRCLAMALRRSARRVSRLYDEALAAHGLNAGQLGVLAAVATMGRPSVQALADVLEMDQSATSRTLGPLEREGLVAGGRDAADRRRRRVALTDAGRARLHAAARDWQAVQHRLEVAHGAQDLAGIRAALDGLGRSEGPATERG